MGPDVERGREREMSAVLLFVFFFVLFRLFSNSHS